MGAVPPPKPSYISDPDVYHRMMLMEKSDELKGLSRQRNKIVVQLVLILLIIVAYIIFGG